MSNRLGEGKVSTFKQAAWVQPSKTLYITNIPPPDNALPDLEANLRVQDGFEPPMRLGKGGAVVFADFKDIQSATNALHILMSMKFDNWTGEGLRISYDKDDTKKKRKQREDQEVMEKADSMCPRLLCCICGTFCLKLSKPLEKLPRRGTDSSHVINEAKHLVELVANKGEVLHIKRDKGVETQCRLQCEHCSALIAYRPVPIGEPTKYMYLLPDVVSVGSAPPATRPAERCLGAWPAAPGGGTAQVTDAKRPKLT